MSVGRHPDVNGNLILTVPGNGSGGASFADARLDSDYGGLYQPLGSPGLLYSAEAHEGMLSSLVMLPSLGLDVEISFYYDSRSRVNSACGYRRFCSLDLSARASGTPIESGPFQGRLSTVTLIRGNSARVVYVYDVNAQTFFARTPGVLNVLHLEGGLWIEETPDGRRSAYPINDNGKRARIVWVEDALGNRHSFVYNDGQLVSLHDAADRNVSFGYNDDGLLETLTDWAGRVTHFGYDVETLHCKPLLTLVTAPDGGQTGYQYDDQGRVTEVTDAQGYRTRYEHSASGKVIKRQLVETNGDIATTRYDYAAGQTLVTNDLNEQMTFDVDEKWRLVGVTNALNHQVSFSYNNRNQETARFDPQGHTWTTKYDDFGFPFEKVNAIGESTTIVYDAHRNPTLITRPDGTTETLIWNSAQLPGGDSSGGIDPTKRLLLGRRDALNYLTLYRYDERGQLREVEVAPNNVTRYSYDTLGNRTLVEDAEGNPAAYVYDAAGNVKKVFDALNYPTSFTYDAGNRVETSTDALGHTTSHEYDLLGNLIRTVDARGAALGYSTGLRYNIFDLPWRTVDALGYATETTYDVLGRSIAVKDALLHTSLTEYDAAGRVHANRDELGRRSVMHYDTAGRLTTSVDPLNNSVSYDYDALSRLSRSVNELGAVTSYEYLETGHKTVTHDALGGQNTTFYDAQGRVEKSTDELGHPTFYEYDDLGRQSAVVDAMGFRTEFGYDRVGRQIEVTQFVNGARLTSRSEYDERGLKTADVDANGNRTEYEYDAIGRQIEMRDATQVGLAQAALHISEYDSVNQMVKTIDPLGHITRYEYDGEGRQTVVENHLGQQSVTHYDALGRQHETVDARGNSTFYYYDAAGQQTSIEDALGQITTYHYDAGGRQWKITNALNQNTFYDYDAAGQLRTTTDALSHITSYEYDALGRQSAIVDANGHRHETTYDAAGRAIGQRDGRGYLTQLGHDALGRQTRVEDAVGNVTTFVYNPRGDLIETRDPLQHVTTFVSDAVGNVTHVTDALGRITTTIYDKLNRATRIDFADGSFIAHVYDVAGRHVRMEDGTGITLYFYDDADQQTGVRYGSGHEVSYVLDAVGNRHTMTDPDGGVTTYTSDALNRWAWLTNPQGEMTQFSYDALSRMTHKTLANGVVESHSFDAAGRESLVEYRNASGMLLSSFTSTYDNAGNRLSVTEADGSVTTYAYDDDDQLTTEQRTGTHPYQISYAYDALGNRTNKVENGVETTYLYGAANRLMSEQTGSSVTTYAYDALGQCTQQTQDGAATLYGWNPLGQMVSVTAPDGTSELYTYCGDGIRRTVTDDAGTRLFIRDGDNVLLETDAQGATRTRYTYECDEWGELLSLRSQGQSHFYGFDSLGHTRALFGIGGVVSDTYLYSAFGESKASSGTTANPFRYGGEVGYYHDDDERLYVRARHLDTGAARWLSQDPLGFAGGDFNLYGYVGNEPTNELDPTGQVAPALLALCGVACGCIGGMVASCVADAFRWPLGQRISAYLKCMDDTRNALHPVAQLAVDVCYGGCNACVTRALKGGTKGGTKGGATRNSASSGRTPRTGRQPKKAQQKRRRENQRRRKQPRRYLYHYTPAKNISSILVSGLRPSIQKPGDPKSDAQHGNGHYLTDLSPTDSMRFTRMQHSAALFKINTMWPTQHNKPWPAIGWIRIDVTDLKVRRVAPLFGQRARGWFPNKGIYLHPSTSRLSFKGKVVQTGTVKFLPSPSGKR